MMYAKRKDSLTFKVLISFVQNNEFSIFLCYWAKEHGYTSLDLLELPTSHLGNPYISLSFKKKKKIRNCIQLRSSFFTPTHAQLTETSVKLASLLLQHLSDMMQSAHQKMRGRRIEGRFVLSEELIKAITRVTSDLIEASSLLILRYAGASEN